jgi:hypothetical protein
MIGRRQIPLNLKSNAQTYVRHNGSEDVMAAIARALSRAFPTTSIEADTLRNIAIF